MTLGKQMVSNFPSSNPPLPISVSYFIEKTETMEKMKARIYLHLPTTNLPARAHTFLHSHLFNGSCLS